MVILTLYIHKYNVINVIVWRKFNKRYHFKCYKKHYKLCYSVMMGGGASGCGDIKEVSLTFVLSGGGNYRMLAPLWILIFDFYMILCSNQIL